MRGEVRSLTEATWVAARLCLERPHGSCCECGVILENSACGDMWLVRGQDTLKLYCPKCKDNAPQDSTV